MLIVDTLVAEILVGQLNSSMFSAISEHDLIHDWLRGIRSRSSQLSLRPNQLTEHCKWPRFGLRGVVFILWRHLGGSFQKDRRPAILTMDHWLIQSPNQSSAPMKRTYSTSCPVSSPTRLSIHARIEPATVLSRISWTLLSEIEKTKIGDALRVSFPTPDQWHLVHNKLPTPGSSHHKTNDSSIPLQYYDSRSACAQVSTSGGSSLMGSRGLQCMVVGWYTVWYG